MNLSFKDMEWCKRSQYLKWAAVAGDVIPMASGEHDFKPKGTLFKYLARAVEEGYSSYGPLRGLPDVIREISRFESLSHNCPVAPGYITPVPSATIALALITNALVGSRDHVVFVGDPVYYAIIRPVLSTGASFSICPFLEDGDIDLRSLSMALRSNTKAIYMANPHSPTGKLAAFDELGEIGKICEEREIVLISDDVYEHFAIDDKYVPCYGAHGYLSEHGYVIGSYAKCYNVTGACASFIVASPKSMNRIEEYYGGPVFMTSIYSQLVVRGCTDEVGWIEELRKRLRRSRDLLTAGLETIPCLRYRRPNAGMFLWVTFDIDDERSIQDVLLRDCQIEVQSRESYCGAKKNQARFNFGTEESVLSEVIERLSIRFS